MANANSNEKRRKKKNLLLSTSNLCHNPPRNLPSTTLPIITLSSLSNFQENFLRMATKKNLSTSFTPLDFRMAKIKSHIRSLSRTNALPLTGEHFPPKKIQRSPNRQGKIRDVHVDSLPRFPTRTMSERIPTFPAPPPPLPPPSSLISLQSYNQYGHFLAYLRRKSLARQRRKREEDDGYTNHIEATIRYSFTKQPSSSSSSFLFQSSSNYSTVSTNTNLSSLTTKRTGRLPTSLRPLPQTIKMTKPVLEDPLLTSSSLLITPRNSVVDDETMSPIIKPSEFYLNDDKLPSQYSGRTRHLRTSIVYI